MSTVTVPLYNLAGKEIEKITLDADVFDGEVNLDLLHQAKLMYEANLRQGTASVKTRGEVRGGGRKPWRQKGTGRARAGSIRSPIWRGGGKVFGPSRRNYYYRLPQRMVRLALKSGLNMRLKENALRVTEDINIDKPKTKIFAQMLKNLKINADVLVLLNDAAKNIELAAGNIPCVDVKTVTEVNVLDILRNEQLILTQSSLAKLISRIKR